MKNKTIYDGYVGEEKCRKELISTINRTKYDDLKEICCKLSFALSPYDLIRIAEAYKNGNQELKDKIEYILEDMNFHSENSLLIYGQADEVIKESKQEIEKYLKLELVKMFEDNYYKFPEERGMLPTNATCLQKHSLIEIEYLVSEGILQKRDCEGLAYEFTDKYIEKLENQKNEINHDEIEMEE